MSDIEHPQLKCSFSHPIINICVNTQCNLKALYCQSQECSQFQPHEDCEHLTLKSLTRSLQKCASIKTSLKNQISSLYDNLYKIIKHEILDDQRSELPIGDLDQDEEQLIKKIYFDKQIVEINSISAKNLSQKIKSNKLSMEKKLPLLVESIKSQMIEIKNKVLEISRKNFKQLESCLMQNLGQRTIMIRQAERIKQQVQNIQMIPQRPQYLNINELVKNQNQMQIYFSLTSKFVEDMKKKYELQISNLQQHVNYQQKILQELFQKSSNKKLEVNLAINQEAKEQSSYKEKEKQFLIQPAKFLHISKVNHIYKRMLFLEKNTDITDQLLGTYQGLADELRINKFLLQSNYFYEKARYACAKLNRKGSKEEAYQIFWIASNYNQLQKYEKALDLFNKSLKMFEKVKGKNKQQEVASTLNNISIVYFNLQKYELAIECSQRAILLQKKMNKNNRIDILIYSKNLGLAYFELEKYQEAQKVFIECLQIISQNSMETIHEECMCYEYLAQVNMFIGRMDLCLEYVLKYLKRNNSEQCILKGRYLDWIIENGDQKLSDELKVSADSILQAYIQLISKIKVKFQSKLAQQINDLVSV